MTNRKLELQENEVVFMEDIYVDIWYSPQHMKMDKVPTKATFTNQRVFFVKGKLAFLFKDFEIDLNEVVEIKKCWVLFLPFGIRLKMKTGNDYVLSVMKRQKYIDWMQQYINK